MTKKASFYFKAIFVVLFACLHFTPKAQKRDMIQNITVEVDQGFPFGVLDFVVTADEKYVVAWSHSNVLKVYSAQTGRFIRSLGNHHTLVTAVSVNPWTGVLMSTDVDGNVIEWTAGLEVKRTYFKKALTMPLDSRGYAEYYNVFYGPAHELGIPCLVYDQELKDLRYVNYDEGDFRLNVEIPGSLYNSEKETWLSSKGVYVLEEYVESTDGLDTGSNKGICEYSPRYFHLLNPESIKKQTFLKLKPYLQKFPGQDYDHLWPLSDTNRFIAGDWTGNPLVRTRYGLDPKNNFSGYLGFQRIDKTNPLVHSFRDTSGFPFLSGSVYKPVMAVRKKEKLRWIDLSNFNILTFSVEEDNSALATPCLDTTGNFVSVSYKNDLPGRRRKTINIRTGKMTSDSSVFEVPNFLAKQNYAKDPENYESEATSHENYLNNWFKNKTVKRYHFMGLDDGPYHFLELPIDEYYRLGKTIPLISAKEFICPDLEGNLVLFDYPSERVKKKFIAQGISLQIGIVPGTDLFFSQNTEGNVFFYNKKDRSGSGYTAALYVSENGLFMINRDNYYFAYGRPDNFLFFNKNNTVFPFEQFDLKYNRPDKVLQTFGCRDTSLIRSYHNAYLKRLKKMGFTESMLKDEFHLPEIRIENKMHLPSVTDSSGIVLELAVRDEKFKLDRINLYINNVPVYGRNGIDLKQDSTRQLKWKESVGLSEGENKIQVSVLNQAGAESYKETIYMTYKPKQTTRPNLYLVTIGDSKYQDNRYDLTYAAKDAVDIQAAFEGNIVYEKVFRFNLTNEDVTREKVMALKKELQGSKRDDVVMITVAGHGVLDKELNYYLATYNMDFDHPGEKGLAYEDLESLLDGIPALKKILLLDACHSGEVDKEEVEQLAVSTTAAKDIKFRTAGAGLQRKNLGLKTTGELVGELFTDLRRGTGATIISSAGGMEYAMESDQWKNGLFTYCLLYGLKNQAADANHDGQIMLSELHSYLRKEVTRLSGGAQQPVSRIENISLDFRIW